MRLSPGRCLLDRSAFAVRLATLALTTGLSLGFGLIPVTSHGSPPPAGPTALDEYVATADTNFTFHRVGTTTTPTGSVHLIEMTSQAWLTTNEVDRPLWQHWLHIIVPIHVSGPTALLSIGGGSHRKGPPKAPDGNLTRIAVETKTVVAELRDIPNQPLVFHQDGRERSEDDLIAYTWDQFLRTGDARWPARLPMTKAVVRAMDTVTAFCATNTGGLTVTNFFVAGASKRGWTTWTTAAVDSRVVGIAPVVIDVLNLQPSMRHHYAAYGFWAPAVGDYTAHGIMDWMGTPEFQALAKIEDPYTYRQRFTAPKLLLNATGDQFFLPDSAQFYFDDLPGEKFLRYVPNSDHSLKGSDAWETVQAFYQSLLLKRPRPRFTWSYARDGAMTVKMKDAPKAITLWQATNPDARDFRLETLGPRWTNSPLAMEHHACVARVAKPAQGWTAFLVELTYEMPGGHPLKLTTPVRVVPEQTDHEFVPQPPKASR